MMELEDAASKSWNWKMQHRNHGIGRYSIKIMELEDTASKSWKLEDEASKSWNWKIQHQNHGNWKMQHQCRNRPVDDRNVVEECILYTLRIKVPLKGTIR